MNQSKIIQFGQTIRVFRGRAQPFNLIELRLDQLLEDDLEVKIRFGKPSCDLFNLTAL